MQTIFDAVTAFFEKIGTQLLSMSFSDVIDIALLAVVLYYIYRFVRERRAAKLAFGLALLVVLYAVTTLLDMNAMSFLLQNIFQVGLLALIILFQPELRTALEKVGGDPLRSLKNLAEPKELSEKTKAIDNICIAATDMSRDRTGALIVIEQRIGLKDVVETGTTLNSEISSALLENIFEPNTPLHDGAVVIRGNRIMAAACILTLSEGKGISRELGTRHRAALGITETTDAISLIVSEETGIISMARNGRLTRHLDRAGVEEVLTGLYCQKEAGLWATLMEKTKWRKGGAA